MAQRRVLGLVADHGLIAHVELLQQRARLLRKVEQDADDEQVVVGEVVDRVLLLVHDVELRGVLRAVDHVLGRHVEVELHDRVEVQEAVVSDKLRVAHLPVGHLDVVASVRHAEARYRLPADPLQETVGAHDDIRRRCRDIDGRLRRAGATERVLAFPAALVTIAPERRLLTVLEGRLGKVAAIRLVGLHREGREVLLPDVSARDAVRHLRGVRAGDLRDEGVELLHARLQRRLEDHPTDRVTASRVRRVAAVPVPRPLQRGLQQLAEVDALLQVVVRAIPDGSRVARRAEAEVGKELAVPALLHEDHGCHHVHVQDVARQALPVGVAEHHVLDCDLGLVADAINGVRGDWLHGDVVSEEDVALQH
mmetsp:Transcript_19408/g.51306  ORF Transcript_19408/g.51306 Transcript_19408/m.51306 type:complete len:366 (+) Transcript_19408:721-1818(+)